MILRNVPNHGTSYTRLPVPSSLRVVGLWGELFKPLRKPHENVERMIVTNTCPVNTMHNEKQLWYICLRITDEKKVVNTSTFTERKPKHQNKT